jgi:hypothetical protein
MRIKVKALYTVVGILLVVTSIGLVISRGSLYGQAEEDNWVPDLCGTWAGELTGYYYPDVTQPDRIYMKAPFQHDVIITDQTGMVFAGILVDGGDPGKVAGVMLPDRTVSIQIFDPSELRLFMTGRMKVSGSTLEISGYGHMYDDLIDLDSTATMASWYIRLVKVD